MHHVITRVLYFCCLAVLLTGHGADLALPLRCESFGSVVTVW